jgi:VanZ family protein
MGTFVSGKRKLILNWLPAVFAVAVIAGESTPTMSAANTSRWLLPIWVHLFGSVSPEKWNVIHHLIRKTGHFMGYGGVSLCFFHGWSSSLSTERRSVNAIRLRAAALAVFCTLLIASADEFHQSFLPSRTSSPYDVGIDVSGAIVMQIVLLTLLHLYARSRAMNAVAV